MLELLFGSVKGVFNRITYLALAYAFVCAIIGLIFYLNPDLSNSLVAVLCGTILIVNGGIVIYSYINRRDISLFNNNLIYGAFLILIGILVMSVSKLLTIFLAIYLIIVGVQRLNMALVLRQFNEQSWLFTLVIGILFITIAVVTLITKNDSLIKVTGIYLLGYGLINFVHILLLRRRSENFLV